MFRPIAWIGLRQVSLGEGVYQFRQDFIGASLYGFVFSAFGIGIGVSMWQFYTGLGDSSPQVIPFIFIVFGTACLLPAVFGLGHCRRITFDRGAGTVNVRTRTWWRVSETDCAYSAVSLGLHERTRSAGLGAVTDYILMVRLTDRYYVLGRSGKKGAAESLATKTAQELGLPFSWSEERVVSLL